ncbi:hypothetical protein [Herbaspirillum sp. GW103]|uniref:DUF7830 domain-containing protein n=1 Tax=Herbaspirillum sp. GW103 TaxID=1175306 RepID=UPI0012F67070|nr:hypothetical protein [Herbaspirillum sp. GW103]
MRKACHPDTNKRITVPEYIRDFGNDAVETHEQVTCPVCKQRLNIVAPSTVDSVGHFAHRRNSGYCPTKNKAAAPYVGLHPHHPDPEAANRIKTIFLQNWQKHFKMLDWLVKGLAVDEFISVLRAANEERIWEYAQLREFQLPYIFATLMDFPPSHSYREKDGSPARKNWFRCWFDATVQRYDDLWIHRQEPLMFWRAWYELPEGKKKPRSEDLLDSYGMELNSDFLNRDVTLFPFIENKITRWLERNVQVS